MGNNIFEFVKEVKNTCGPVKFTIVIMMGAAGMAIGAGTGLALIPDNPIYITNSIEEVNQNEED